MGVTQPNSWLRKITGGYAEGMAGCGGAAGVGWNGAGESDVGCHERRTGRGVGWEVPG